jgi:hypothetical protein
MVIPTPSQPKLNEMPRDFFKHLAVYTIMRKREFANSKLLPLLDPQDFERGAALGVWCANGPRRSSTCRPRSRPICPAT